MHRILLHACPRGSFAHRWSNGQTRCQSSTASSFANKEANEFLTSDEELEKLSDVGRRHHDGSASKSSDVCKLNSPIDTYCFSLNKCIKQKNLASGLQLHSYLVNNGHELNSFLGSYLIRMFAACGTLSQADQVFSKLQEPSVFAWSAIISAHSKHGSSENAIKLYHIMVYSNTQPDGHIYVAALQACANAAFLVHGEHIYARIVENGSDSHIFLVNGIINMYLKCHSFDNASRVFSASPVRDVVTWNVMMEGCIQHGCFHETLQLLYQMQVEGIQPDNVTYINILRASSCMEVLQQGKKIHLLIFENGFEVDAFVGSALIDMYCKCCSLEDASEAFNTRREVRDVVIWRAMLSGYASHGHVLESFELFCRMQLEGLEIGKLTYASILHACSNATALHYGKLIHTYVVQTQLEADKELGHALVSLYTNCEKVETAHQVFDGLRGPDVVTWTTIMSGYADQGHCLKVFQLFGQMIKEGIKADKVILNIMLKACTRGSNLELGRLVHTYIQEDTFESDFRSRNSLVEIYARFELYEDAQWIFARLFTESFVTQRLSNVENVSGVLPLKLSKEIQEGVIVSGLQSCSTMEDWEGTQLVHFYLIEIGFKWSVQVIGSFISIYASCGMLDDARNVFETLQSHDVALWCSMIAGYAHHGRSVEALQMFFGMQQQGLQPNQTTFVSILKAFTSSSFLKQGRMMHTRLSTCNMGGKREINSTLIDMYAKCGSLRDAQSVFDKLVIRDTLTWNALITGYASDCNFQKAFELFDAMQKLDSKKDTSPLVGILKACSSPKVICFGKLIHHVMYESGCEFDVSLGNSLINMYIKCGSLDDGERVFDRSRCRSRVTWSLIISGLAQSGNFEKAMLVFQQMQQAGLTSDSVTVVSALKACSSTGTLINGMLLHVVVILGELKFNIYLANTLITMYSNCGTLEDALKVFVRLPLRDTATWNAIIAGCTHNNKWEMAWRYFKNMENDGVRPDAITFVCVLSACSHMGRVEDGLHQFQCMIQQHGLTPTAEHYNCIIDLLGRTGYLLKAEDLLCSLPFIHNHVGWMSLLGHSNLHESTDVGSRCIDSIIKDESRNASGYLLMARIYSHAGHAQEADRVEGLRTDVNAWKQPGLAFIDVNENTCSFGVQHAECFPNSSADEKLVRLKLQMKDQGYLPCA